MAVLGITEIAKVASNGPSFRGCQKGSATWRRPITGAILGYCFSRKSEKNCDAGETPDGAAITAALSQGRRPAAVTEVLIVDVDLGVYDRLLEPREAHEYESR